MLGRDVVVNFECAQKNRELGYPDLRADLDIYASDQNWGDPKGRSGKSWMFPAILIKNGKRFSPHFEEKDGFESPETPSFSENEGSFYDGNRCFSG